MILSTTILSTGASYLEMTLNDSSHYSAQASFLLLFVESGTRKLRKVVESRTKFLFDVKRVLDSTTAKRCRVSRQA